MPSTYYSSCNLRVCVALSCPQHCPTGELKKFLLFKFGPWPNDILREPFSMFRPWFITYFQHVIKHQPLNMNLKRWTHDTPRPFDNLPFVIKSRIGATLKFTVFFGIALWSPFGILWYMMAKRTM